MIFYLLLLLNKIFAVQNSFLPDIEESAESPKLQSDEHFGGKMLNIVKNSQNRIILRLFELFRPFTAKNVMTVVVATTVQQLTNFYTFIILQEDYSEKVSLI